MLYVLRDASLIVSQAYSNEVDSDVVYWLMIYHITVTQISCDYINA